MQILAGKYDIRVVPWIDMVQDIPGLCCDLVTAQEKPGRFLFLGKKMAKFKTQFDKRPVKDGVFPCDDDTDRKRVDNRKALQLCSQVFEILNMTFGEVRDELLQMSYVESVVPAPDSTQLLVTVASKDDINDVFESLQRCSGFLRHEVANGITRKRVPNLKFVVKNY